MLNSTLLLGIFLLSIHPQTSITPGYLNPVTLSAIPDRPDNAFSGSRFSESTATFCSRKRQEFAIHELCRGNIPDFLRTFIPITLSYTPDDWPKPITAVIWVTPDYLSIGYDNDFLRIPLSYPAAVTVASKFGCILPTRKIVDAIYRQSALHYTPQPMKPGPLMRSNAYFLEHQSRIEKQRGGRPLGILCAGHKKDVVLTNRLREKPGRVAIYGWHKPNGEPIQGLSTVHGARYADYSHGVRLVNRWVLIDGEYRSIFDLLNNPRLAPLFTYEGVINNARGLMSHRTFKTNDAEPSGRGAYRIP